MKFDMIVIALEDDVKKLLSNIKFINDYIKYDNLIFIGNDKVEEIILNQKTNKIKFINENKLVKNMDFNSVKKLILKRNGDSKRTGWYFQQFLKLGYSKICKNDYYLVWDADTIPCKNVELFSENNKPVFHLKTEYHKPYFETIDNLFDSKYKREIKKSFISEHMVFNTKIVKSMLKEIEKNNELTGKYFWDKIIFSIKDINDLNHSGFSEFETYGTYVYSKYREMYEYKVWKSLRSGIYFFKYPISMKQLKWIAKDYDAISFEKHDRLSGLYKIWNNDFFYKHISVNLVTKIMWPFMMFRKYIIHK